MNQLIEAATADVVNAFNDATNRHDVDAMMALMTADVAFESTGPSPDGMRIVGQDAVREVWDTLFRDAPSARFEGEEMVVQGDRCTVRWVYHWTNADGSAGHVRGIDLIRVTEGKIAEKYAYVKG